METPEAIPFEPNDKAPSRFLDWLRREGPACGRAALDIDLIADASAPNYHVVLDLPEGTQVPPPGMVSAPFVTTRLNVGELTDRLRDAANLLVGHVATEPTGRSRSRPWEIQLERHAAKVGTAAGNLRGLLRSVSAEVQDLDVPGSWIDLTGGLDDVIETIVQLTQDWDQAAFDSETAWASSVEAIVLTEVGGGKERAGTSLPSLVDQCKTLIRLMPPNDESTITKRYRPRDEGHADRIHIAVPSKDRAPRTVPTQSSRFQTGIYLVEPLPHTTTNLANTLNTAMIALTGSVLGLSAATTALRPEHPAVPLEMSAVVAILVLFAGVQAARIERPDRTSPRGWLGRMPYLLGFLSPLPSASSCRVGRRRRGGALPRLGARRTGGHSVRIGCPRAALLGVSRHPRGTRSDDLGPPPRTVIVPRCAELRCG